MANTKVTQHVIADNAITTAMITDANVTHAKLHGTMDLSGKTVTLPAVAIPSASTATTQSASDNTTKVATTAYVTTALANLVDSSPSSLNTLNELAAALNDDASFSTTVTNSLATKAPLASPTFTGNINGGDNVKLQLGASQDLQIYHNGSNSDRIDSSSSYLVIEAANTIIRKPGGSEDYAKFLSDGAVELYHNNVKKFETTSTGATLNGTGALVLPQGTTGQRPTAATGQLRWNTTDGALEVYNGSAWTAVGTSASNKILDTFTGDGSTTAFTLSITPANEDALLVFIDGVYQEKGDYALSNAVLTLDTAPASGEKVAVHTTTASVHDGTSALTQQFTGNGSTTAFTLSQDPGGENNTQVFVNGVYQAKTTYSVSGTTLTFASAPANSAVIEVVMFTVATLGNSDTVTEGSSNLYHTSARAISAISGATLTGDLQAPGIYVGSTNTSYDLYNNGTSYLNGSVVIDDSLQVTNGFNMSSGTLEFADGNASFDSSNSSGYSVFSHTNGSAQIGFARAGGNTGIGYIGADSTYNLSVFDSSFNRKMVLTQAGNVGIAVTDPDARLEIKSAGGGSESALKVTDSSDNNVFIQQGGGRAIFHYGPVMVAAETDIMHANMDDLQVGNAVGNRGMTIASGNGSYGTLAFADGSSGNAAYRGFIEYFHNEDSIRLGTSGTEAMRIDSSGTLIVDRNDKPNAGEKVAVSREGIAICAGTDSGEYRLMYGNNSSNMILYFSSGSNQAQLTAAGAWQNASDLAYKKDIVDIHYGLDTVKKLKPRTYKMKTDDEQQIGFVAQELELDIPEVVGGEDGNKGVSYGQLTAVLTKAIQEQQTIIEDLKSRIETLEG